MPTISVTSLVNDPAQNQIVASSFAQLGINKPVTLENIATTYSTKGEDFTASLLNNLAIAQNANLSDAAKEQIKTVLGGILKQAIDKANEVIIQQGKTPIPNPQAGNSEVKGGNNTPTNEQTDYKPFLFVGAIILVVSAIWAFAKKKR
jgi:hypothetical protein